MSGATAPHHHVPAADAPMRTRLLSARLLALLLRLRVSGEIAYRDRTGFTDLQRRLLTLVGNFDGLTSVELVALTGMQKAQVSRTLATVVRAGLVERASLRARVQLSPAGRKAFRQIMDLARTRNADLTEGVPPDELAWFTTATLALTERAKLLLAQERDREDAGAAEPELPPMPERLRPMDADRPLSLMIAPPLITLVAFLQRSATIVYRRATGLSNFEWQLMTQIGEYAPVGLARVIELLGRDKSQVGRSVQRLEAQGLVVRVGVPGRSVSLDVTPAGRALYAEMCDVAIARDDYLLADMSEAERLRYRAVVERLTANADRLPGAGRTGRA